MKCCKCGSDQPAMNEFYDGLYCIDCINKYHPAPLSRREAMKRGYS